jgi:hypothetical protein
MRRIRTLSALLLATNVTAVLGGCSRNGAGGSNVPTEATPSPRQTSALVSPTSSHDGLEVSFTLLPEVKQERVPLRAFGLRFKNASSHPIRIYMPSSEPFRAGISTLYIMGARGSIAVPEPRGHGYVVTEVDFPLLAPGETRTFEQPFSLDELADGGRFERVKGFEPGTAVRVSWTYENTITRWKAGIQTVDGPTKEVFGGGPIPHIWTGELTVEATWTLP